MIAPVAAQCEERPIPLAAPPRVEEIICVCHFSLLAFVAQGIGVGDYPAGDAPAGKDGAERKATVPVEYRNEGTWHRELQGEQSLSSQSPSQTQKKERQTLDLLALRFAMRMLSCPTVLTVHLHFKYTTLTKAP